MKKIFGLIFGVMLLFFIIGFIYISIYETTPIMKGVTHVYLDFVSVDEDGWYAYGKERMKKEIIDADDKNYLIRFFSSKFKLDDSFGCKCPKNDVLIVFETNDQTYTFGMGVGIGGDPNMYYHNSSKSCEYNIDQLVEILTFFSKFDETINYNLEMMIEVYSMW